MEREDLQRIKERIAKLLAMAADASSPNEAVIAAQRARALMDKYQLDEYDISEAAPQEFGEADVSRAFASIPFHVNTLSVAVAKYNDCQSCTEWAKMDYRMDGKARLNGRDGRTTKRVGKKIVFRGYKHDVELAKEMYERLLQAIDRLCKAYMQANHPGKYNVRIGGDYKAACANAIMSNLESMMVERKQLTAVAGTSLVVIKEQRVDEHFGSVEYSKARKHSQARDLQGFIDSEAAREAGWRDGHTVEITKRLDD